MYWSNQMKFDIDSEGFVTFNGVRPQKIEQAPKGDLVCKGGTKSPGPQEHPAPPLSTLEPTVGAAAPIALNLPEPKELATLGSKTISGDAKSKTPSTLSINQGETPDCWAIGSMKIMLVQRPGDLYAWVKQNSDTSLTININKQGVSYVATVDNRFPAGPFEGFQYSFSKDGTWACMAIEKAMVWSLSKDNSYSEVTTGWPSQFFNLFGVACSTSAINPNYESRWQAAWTKNECVTIGSNATTTDGFTADHLYGLYPKQNPDKTFTVIDPWGFSSTSSIGVFTATPAQILANFTDDCITVFNRTAIPYVSTPTLTPTPVPSETIDLSKPDTGQIGYGASVQGETLSMAGINSYAQYTVAIPSTKSYTVTIKLKNTGGIFAFYNGTTKLITKNINSTTLTFNLNLSKGNLALRIQAIGLVQNVIESITLQ
jgi:hypothetical protein